MKMGRKIPLCFTFLVYSTELGNKLETNAIYAEKTEIIEDHQSVDIIVTSYKY